jgi:hypothetical protein
MSDLPIVPKVTVSAVVLTQEDLQDKETEE